MIRVFAQALTPCCQSPRRPGEPVLHRSDGCCHLISISGNSTAYHTDVSSKGLASRTRSSSSQAFSEVKWCNSDWIPATVHGHYSALESGIYHALHHLLRTLHILRTTHNHPRCTIAGRKSIHPSSHSHCHKSACKHAVGQLRVIYMHAAPSMPMTLPFTHSPSWEARKQTTRAMSIGWPTRCIGDQVLAYYIQVSKMVSREGC